MASLSKLKELDVSFNDLKSIPESLCLATSLIKLNIGNNFADLQSLPRSIGNLELLEELDISNNQIRVLPDSFGMLSHLRLIHAEENPLEVPPRHIAEMDAQAIVQYMAEYVKVRPLKSKMSCAQFCFFSRPNKRKHDGFDHVNSDYRLRVTEMNIFFCWIITYHMFCSCCYLSSAFILASKSECIIQCGIMIVMHICKENLFQAHVTDVSRMWFQCPLKPGIWRGSCYLHM